MNQQTLLTILPVLLPIALTTAIAWLERRGQEARVNRLIESAQKRVIFLNAFLTTQSQATTPEQFEVVKRSVAKEVTV